MKIGELPIRERPLRELLHFADDRLDVDRSYAGYGWARAPRVWLTDAAGPARPVDDAVVLALHACDVGEVMAGDVELEFELPGAEPVTALASQLLSVWLPRLPPARAVVLAMCNPHRAILAPVATASAPVYYATGDVESWLDQRGETERVELHAAGSWARLDA